ncbi:MAG: ribonuclease III [Candidatus Levybacteria bacterium RIFCSPHIGHO2_02_FULL_39_36]|nr:MAG: Ribonuclease 3 [Candidatus Levybacteria bacterium GW2011_GWA1_39_11]KKR25325.1 MAG: Ribonuclease 3 [Candidatus Levybacteria bacterium GW2011_GWB1_39_7]KKR27598.1 MAG: Ribonuclease 3 [Microgenomates group bacterium GW2011_GWC1_39_7]KKR50428.1 MAG: Ribonuclease 3 [Candidatus Levybacteria bacterium GW2011_GWA2_40_16]OGH14484.1 MAG: ribonuclease III [Candidatus Levybacteria bacterium RIFCSPHIGHO2_01_FULL_38_96]OGH25490.1 MAG: ribonuclease III [Candidatus Levybacteria bacterium RIFCSPHIGHO2
MNIPKFKDQKLFKQVFIHRSYLNETQENIESNERLEFLGDSILSFVVSSHIFIKHKDLKEGELTNIRSVLTNTETLYEISKELGLGQALKLSKGEEQSGGRENKTILADTLEAIIGGIYIDQGLEKASEFIEENILDKAEGIIENKGLKDPKSKLQEELQEKYKISPSYITIKEEGPDHSKFYTIGVYLGEKLLAEGFGHSKQEAEKSAAKQALENLSLRS